MPERKTLYFPAPKRRGLVGPVTYKGLPVIFCTQRNCRFCNLSARQELQGWVGGRLMIELVLCQRPSLFRPQPFYSGHLQAVVEREQIDTGAEFDVSGLNTICLSTPSGKIIIDPGEMGFDSTFSLAGLIGGQDIVATVVSHGHQDHWNLAGQVEKGPIYLSGLTSRLINRHLAFEWDPPLARACHRMRNIKPGQQLNLNSVQIQTFPLPHSIPETMGLDIRGRKKRMICLGDFRLSGWRWEARAMIMFFLRGLAEQRKVDLLALNIVNAHIPGFTPSEGLIIDPLTDILMGARSRVIIACFSTNLERIRRIVELARILGRPVVFYGAGMEFARERLGIKDNYRAKGQSVIFVTGCQAEEYSVLWRIANNENPPLELQLRDTLVFSSRCIPGSGNEAGLRSLITTLRPQVGRVVVSTGEINQVGLSRLLGVEEAPVHVSGHESGEGLRQVLEILRPKQVLAWPHTSPQIKAFQRIAGRLGIEILPETERVIEV